MKTGILLSACMIVKNEESNLERCLKSIKELVDEIVVVDTGSTDKTIEIAHRYGARVYHHEWQNDFSFHRNQAMDYAIGKWVMTVDADEEIFTEKGKTWKDVRTFLEKIDGRYIASAITVKDIQQGSNVLQFSSARFFKKGMVEYKGMVHNQPTLKVQSDAAHCPYLYLHHYGYDLSPEQKQAKFERTSGLLMKQIETGQMEDMFPYFYLCQIYADNRQPEEAVKWAEKYLENKDKITKDHFCDSIFFTVVKQYMKIGDKDKAKQWLEMGIVALPGDLDMSLAALEYGVWVNDLNLQIQAAKDFTTIYRMYQKDPTLKGNRFVYAQRPEAMAYVLFHQTLSELKDGIQALSSLMNLLSTLNPAFRDGMINELEQELLKAAIPIHIQRGDPAEEKSVKNKNNFVSQTIQ